MKINESRINKYQAGGFMSYQPIPVVPEAASQPMEQTAPADAGQAAADGLLDPDIFKKMIGEGISNDVVAFQDTLTNAQAQYANMSEFERNGAKGKKLRGMMKGDLASLNMLFRNKKQFDDLITNVKSNAAAGELAVTTRGMIVKDMKTGRVGEVSHEDYAKDIKAGEARKYQALTNAELINEREYNKNLVGDEKSFEALNTAIGMTKIKDEVFQILSHVQASSSKVTGNKYLDATNEKLAKGYEKIVGMAQEGVYDITQMQSSEGNSEALKLAAKTMWTNLSENSRSVLKARAVARGADPAKIEEEALSFAISLLAPSEYHKTEQSTMIGYDKEATEARTGKVTGAKEAEVGYWQGINNSMGAMLPVTINEGSSYQFKALGSQAGGFMKDSNTPYGTTTVGNITQLSAVGDTNSVSFGGEILDKSVLDSLVYTNSKVINVDLPFVTEGGKVKPDLEMAKRLGEVDTKVKALGSAATAAARESIYRSNGIPTDGRGNYTIQKKAFMTFEALGNDRTIKNADPRFVTNTSNSKDADAIKQLYENTYVYDGKPTTKANKIDRPDWNPDTFNLTAWGAPNVLKSTVYIPISNDKEGARHVDGQGIEVPKSMVSHQSLTTFGNQNNTESVMTNGSGNAGKYSLPQ